MIRSYLIHPSIYHIRDEIRSLLRIIDPYLKEVRNYSKDCLIIASVEEVIKNFGSNMFYVTKNVLNDMIKMELNVFPFNDDSKQLISLSLLSFNVTSVGFSSIEKVEIYKHVLLLCGKYSKDLNEQTNIVISNAVLSPKIDDARKMSIPIIKKEWLDSCYSGLKLFLIDDFKCGIFQNVVFTSTDLTKNENKALKNIIVNNGGKWTDKLDDTVDFVITNSMVITKKIKIALDSEIPIIKKRCIDDSIVSGHLLLTKDYLLNWWIRYDEKDELFKDISFATNNETIITAIIAHSGQIVNPIIAQYVIVDCEMKCTELLDKTVMEKWLWSCIESHTIIDPEICVLYKPISFNVPVPSFKGVMITILETDQKISSELSEAVRILGGIPINHIHQSAKMIISSTTSENLEKIKESYPKIRIIKPQFIFDFLKKGFMPNPNDYLLIKSQKINMKSEQCESNKTTKCHPEHESGASEVEVDTISHSKSVHYLD